jgi:hypothetical protein
MTTLCGGCIYYIQRSNLPESHYAITPYWHTAPHLSLPTTAPGRQVYQARAAIRLPLMGTACNPSFQIMTKIQVLIHNLSYIYLKKIKKIVRCNFELEIFSGPKIATYFPSLELISVHT